MLNSCRKLFVFRNVFAATKLPEFSAVCHRYISFDRKEIEQYQQDGVVCLRDRFSKYWVDTVKRGIQQVFDNPSEYSEKITSDCGKGVYFNDYYQWKNIDEFKKYVKESPAPAIAAAFMGEKEVVFYHEHVFVKESFNESATPWHHDQSYYPLDGWQNCSIWMPVTPVEAKTGLQFIKGSHRWEKWFAPRYLETAENYHMENSENGRHYETMPEIKEEEHEILLWDMEPGDCLVFHMRAVHGAYAITSNTSRQTLVTRWLGSDVTLAQRPWKTSPPVIPSDITYGDLVKNSNDFQIYSVADKQFAR